MKQRNVLWKKQSDSILLILLESGGSTSMMTKYQELPIHIALKNESTSEAHFRDINLLLQRCKTIDTSHMNSSLIMAAKFCNFEIIDKIIKLGADVNFKNGDGNTALHTYMDCLDFDLKVVSTMLQHGATFNELNDSMETPLMRYIIRGRREVLTENVVFMVDNGADVNICGDRRNSALILAITNDIPEIVETLIKAKANVNHIGENGNTALHLVLAKGHTSHSKVSSKDTKNSIPLLDCLLKEHPRLDVKDQDDETPLTKVFKHLNKGYFYRGDELTEVCYILRRLLDAGAFSSQDDLNKALVTVAKKGDFVTMKSLVGHGANKHVQDNRSNTVLHLCWCEAKSNIMEVVARLLKGNSLLFGLNDSGKSSLYLATAMSRNRYHYGKRLERENNSEVVQLLLKYGENPNQHLEYIPLVLAIEEGDVSTTNLLLNAGANVNVVNKDGKTCLHILFTRDFDTGQLCFLCF
ncbi:unnamed protein product [Mytilus coruscus]|uniref:Uncharacterized protein n=1 Tax=Mytilus coruscus TaxID=42192 RepID=A0A6J8C9U5_MYTCO|nr:unnamed protein product [Mytilus coruscus]